MKHYIGRYKDLKIRLNEQLYKLTGQNLDFYSSLTMEDLLGLKRLLANVNNILTLQMTIFAAGWLCNYFSLSHTCRQDILNAIDRTKPNTNGFDIHITKPVKIIGEVKCIVPINNEDKYGGAQWNSILDDAHKLKNKPDNAAFSDYYKFLFLIDLGTRTEKAVSHLLQPSTGTSELPLRKNRHLIKKHIILFNDQIRMEDLAHEKVYLKMMKLK